MSKAEFICCDTCGRDLFVPFSSSSIAENVHHVMDFYVANTSEGIVHLCPKCYNAGLLKEYKLKVSEIELVKTVGYNAMDKEVQDGNDNS